MLPPIWCMLDKFWTILDHCLIGSKVMQRSAHVCVATSPCLTVSSACPPSASDYPVQVEMSQPFVCPLDHSYELPEMYNLGLDWREHSFFARSAHPTPSVARGLREAIVPPPSSSTHSRAARIPSSPHPLPPLILFHPPRAAHAHPRPPPSPLPASARSTSASALFSGRRPAVTLPRRHASSTWTTARHLPRRWRRLLSRRCRDVAEMSPRCRREPMPQLDT